jgi:hypothetical protein
MKSKAYETIFGKFLPKNIMNREDLLSSTTQIEMPIEEPTIIEQPLPNPLKKAKSLLFDENGRVKRRFI